MAFTKHYMWQVTWLIIVLNYIKPGSYDQNILSRYPCFRFLWATNQGEEGAGDYPSSPPWEEMCFFFSFLFFKKKWASWIFHKKKKIGYLRSFTLISRDQVWGWSPTRKEGQRNGPIRWEEDEVYLNRSEPSARDTCPATVGRYSLNATARTTDTRDSLSLFVSLLFLYHYYHRHPGIFFFEVTVDNWIMLRFVCVPLLLSLLRAGKKLFFYTAV